jgi:hypothetical protein
MGGSRAKFVAMLLIAFVTIGAQCVASCAVESIVPAKPPCHQQSDDSCSHDRTADSGAKLSAIERPLAIDTLPVIHHTTPLAPLTGVEAAPAPVAQSVYSVSTTVLRI